MDAGRITLRISDYKEMRRIVNLERHSETTVRLGDISLDDVKITTVTCNQVGDSSWRVEIEIRSA